MALWYKMEKIDYYQKCAIGLYSQECKGRNFIFVSGKPELKEGFNDFLSIKRVRVISATVMLYLFRKYPNTNTNEITALSG